jgi:sulfoquinovose isomerase
MASLSRDLTWLGNPAHERWLEQETDALLRFAARSRTDRAFGYLDAAGEVDAGHPAELWITCRMTHAFALGALLGRPGCAPLVDHGLRALQTVFADDAHGGWFSSVGPGGPVTTRKEAYPHAFVLLAASSALAAGRPGAGELLRRAEQVSVEQFWREDEGMVAESFDRTFTTPEDYRGVNSTMHTVEAYLAVTDVTEEGIWLDRAVRMTERVVDGFARRHGWRLPEHFTAAWEPVYDYNSEEPADPFRPFGATVGHWFEWARLTLQAREALRLRGREPGEWMLDGARQLFDAGVRDGWNVDGAPGLVYTVDLDGVPVVRQRMHWVVAEAIGAAAVLHRVTGDVDYARWYRTWWDYAAEYLVEAPGAWVHELDSANQPAAGTWAGKPDVYHALQATLVPRLPVAPALAASLAASLAAGSR